MAAEAIARCSDRMAGSSEQWQQKRLHAAVNGVVTLLPVVLENEKVQVFQSGLSAVLDTDFGLRVTSYYKHTCGLCGNYNLKPEDDVPQGGSDLTAVLAWAKGWKVPDDDDPFCWDYCEGTCPVCEEEKRELYGGNQYCGLIKKTFQGPFQACHDVVKPKDFYRNCLYDVCMSHGAKQILCQVLEAYASTCKKHGVVVRDWRTPSGCPLPCPQNSHYEACGNACPATCANRDAPTNCIQPCVETCACNEGYVLSGGQCVAMASCGCTRDGRYYRPGEEFWGDESCHSWCKCDPDLGMVVCKETRCKADETCTMVNGVRRCVAKTRSICVATGDPHYTTFDGRRYDFMGTCIYQLAALCSDDPTLVPFTVTVQNNNRGSHVVSFTKEVTLNVYNMTLSLSQMHPQKLQVNGILVDLPFSHGNKLHAYLRGVHGFIKTDFDVIVTFDWYSYTRVILPSTYSQAVCGLCGNANGDPQDDFVLPSGQLAADEIQFADSWKVADVPGCQAGCTENCEVCTEAQKRTYQGDKHCGILIKKWGPLAACHDTINPAPYFNDCLFDACIYKGHQDIVCQAISAYVTTCQSQGIRIKQWRTAIFCSPICPPNQHYELCGPPLPCHLPRAARGGGMRRPPTIASEGCFCDEGSFLSGDTCVTLPHCGCLHQGRYLQGGFAGTCTYTLAAVEAAGPSDTLMPFKVEVEKESGQGAPVIRQLLVTVLGVTVGMARGTSWEVTVDGEQHLLPLTLAEGAMTVSQEGAHRVLRVRDGLKLLYNGDAYALLTLPDAYRQRTTGLCGDFNSDASDDLSAPQELGEPTGPFAGCHAVVTPQEYLEGCKQEQCTQGTKALCHSLQALRRCLPGRRRAAARVAGGCQLPCDHACASVLGGAPCTTKCFEGCQCDSGFLFNGNECVVPEGLWLHAPWPLLQDFAIFARGHRSQTLSPACLASQITQTVLSPDCSKRCRCQAAGGMQCQEAGCPFGKVCGMRNGVRTCVEQLGRCLLAPATHFVSFDGATGTTVATGIYVASTLCDPHDAAWFRLLADVGEKGERPAVAALHLFSSKAFVTIKRDQKVWGTSPHPYDGGTSPHVGFHHPGEGQWWRNDPGPGSFILIYILF
ncbi:IgGFc-binding protein-like [Falco peregrinus]|uniref:IgGFc-binding protein-like n=1 Tax=Falco peregrinus TaxID=8954 RepID=UPI002479251E|nr:IgGFc-binding protein-like [Falco peregrinus]